LVRAWAVLGVLGFELRNPYPLHRQKGSGAGAWCRRGWVGLEAIPTWDERDPDRDRWPRLENIRCLSGGGDDGRSP
jgi:hypothetical protein